MWEEREVVMSGCFLSGFVFVFYSLSFFFFFEIFSPHENLCFISDGNEGKVEYHLYIAT